MNKTIICSCSEVIVLFQIKQSASIMHVILKKLGVYEDTLTKAEQSFLDEQGYLPLKNIFSECVEQLRQRVAELMEIEGDNAGWEVRQAAKGAVQNRADEGSERLSNLVDKGDVFRICYSNPRVLAAISHVLHADFRLSSLNYRASLPGFGLQPLHVDWKEAVKPGAFQVCNSIWLLDDFTPQNGATRIVPGSHLWGRRPQDEMEDVMAHHSDEVLIQGKAGTVVVFNSHVWHGGTQNTSSSPRRALHSYFCRRDQPPQTDQRAFVKPETISRMSAELCYVLDV